MSLPPKPKAKPKAKAKKKAASKYKSKTAHLDSHESDAKEPIYGNPAAAKFGDTSELVEAPPKADTGRPTDYKPEFCQMLTDHMSKGYPFETFAGIIRVAKSSIYKWANEFAAFSEAKKLGESLCYMHWMRVGQGLAHGKIKGNVTAWIFIMKNICHWRDHSNTQIGIGIGIGDNPNAIPLTIDAEKSATPIFNVEVNENGKFKNLRPRRVN